MGSMWSVDVSCSREEETIVIAILALAKQLPRPLTYYTRAFGALSTFFDGHGHPRGDHNPSERSVGMARRIRGK